MSVKGGKCVELQSVVCGISHHQGFTFCSHVLQNKRLMDQYSIKKLEIILLGINYCPSLKLRLDLAAPKLNQAVRKQEGILCDSTGEFSLFFCLWSV